MTTVAEHAEKDTLRTETANDSDAGATPSIVATGQHRHIGRRQILEGFTDNGLLIDAHIGLLT